MPPRRSPAMRRMRAWSGSSWPRRAPTTAGWPTRPCRSTRRASSRRSRSTPSRRWRSRQYLLALDPPPFAVTCLRFATVYGAAPRMRFDLTVNEFTRDLWADRKLEVFGEQFWRPYVHVRDAARGIRAVLEAPLRGRGGRGLQRRRLGRELPQARSRGADQRSRPTEARSHTFIETKTRATTRCPSRRSGNGSAIEVTMTVPTGIKEVLEALDADRFPDSVRCPLPEHSLRSRCSTSGSSRRTSRRSWTCCAPAG